MKGSRKTLITSALVLALLFSGAAMLLAALTTNQNASIVIGHEYFTQTGVNEADANEDTLNNPAYAFATGSMLFVADYTNHRALIYNSIPTTDNENADVVLGQSNMQSNTANRGGSLAANTLNSPRSIYYDGTKLYIADQGNHRVLIFNTLPTVNGTAADVAVGQPNLTTTGSACSSVKTNAPQGVYAYGGKLYIADSGNHRVIIFNTVPVASGAAADVIVGQVNNATCSNVAAGAATLKFPQGVFSDGVKLYVADTNNHRVTIYNTIPSSDGASADVAVGQANLTSGTADQGGAAAANTLDTPRSVFVQSGKLIVADANNHRIMIYNTVPTAHNTSADVEVGQPNMAGATANNGGIGAGTLSTPYAANSDGALLIVADSNNHRVLIYNSIPVANNPSANVVVGQQNFTSNSANQAGAGTVITGYSIKQPYNVVKSGSKLFIADSGNNRVMIFNTEPVANHPFADVVVGQTLKTSGGSGITASTMNVPIGLFATGTKLFVADQNNNRVLIFNTIPVADGASADVVIGQPDKISNSANQGGTAQAYTLSSPRSVYCDGTKVYIADYNNSRVLIYNSIPAADNASADVAVGQLNKTSSGTGTTSTTLKNPWEAMALAGGKLYIADTNNSRVLIYNSIPAADGAAADYVVGQSLMTGGTANQGGAAAANTLNLPRGVYSNGSKLLIADSGNHRVLVYQSIPAANNVSADNVIGQSVMTGATANQGTSAGKNTLSTPTRIFYDDPKLYVGDFGNSRALIYKPYVENGQVIRMW